MTISAPIVAAIRHGAGSATSCAKPSTAPSPSRCRSSAWRLLPASCRPRPLLLLLIHIVLIELAFNVVCTLVYEAEPATDELMARPPAGAPGSACSPGVAWPAAWRRGGCALAACLAVFLLLRGTHDDDSTRAATIIHAQRGDGAVLIANRAQTQPLWRTLRTPSRALAWSAVAILSLLALAFALPAAQSHLHVRLPACRIWPSVSAPASAASAPAC